MPDGEQNVLWKKKLPPEVYASLAEGKGEPPHSGKYVKTKASGTYRCAGCGAPLFDAEEKVENDSGYATFCVRDTSTVEFIRTYGDDGSEHTSAVCAQCKGHVGTVGSSAVLNEEEYAQGAGVRCVHAFSRSLTLRKAFTPVNYPITFLLVLAVLLGGAAVAWHSLQNITGMGRYEHVSGVVDITIDNSQIQARLTSVHATTSAVTLDEGPVLLALDESARCRVLSKSPVDVLWLDATYTAIGGDVAVEPPYSGWVQGPPEARLVLLVPTGTLPPTSFSKGTFIYFNTKELVR